MRELVADDFKKAKKNPFYDKLVKEVSIPISREDYAVFEEIAKMNEEMPEVVMKRCLKAEAKELQEHVGMEGVRCMQCGKFGESNWAKLKYIDGYDWVCRSCKCEHEDHQISKIKEAFLVEFKDEFKIKAVYTDGLEYTFSKGDTAWLLHDKLSIGEIVFFYSNNKNWFDDVGLLGHVKKSEFVHAFDNGIISRK